MLRAELQAIAEKLLSLQVPALSLDHVAEAIGTLRVTPDEIGELFDTLEAQGRPVDDVHGPGAADLLRQVLSTARALRLTLGRAPQPREIAERSQLPLELVQRGLWFARILQR
jgi:hypothetical protein